MQDLIGRAFQSHIMFDNSHETVRDNGHTDFFRNFAHGNVAKHNGIVVESKAYFFPGIFKMLVVRFSQASFIM